MQFLHLWSTLALAHVSLKEVRGLVTKELEGRDGALAALRARVLELEAGCVKLCGAASEVPPR